MTGYDGVIASGSKVSRGIIRTTATSIEQTDYSGFYSYENNFFLIGGINASGTYSRKLWYSSDGADFAITDVALPFSGTKSPRLLGSGTTVYILNGTWESGSLQNIYSGTINTTTRKMDWVSTPVMTASTLLSGVFNAAYNVDAAQIYTSSGTITLSNLSETIRSFGAANHYSGTMYFDPLRKVLWASNTGSRTETVISGAAYYETTSTPFAFTCQQVTGSTTWNCVHSGGATFNTALFYDVNLGVIEPLTCVVTATDLTATFASASSGYAFIMSGAVMDYSTTWIFSSSHAHQPFVAVVSGTIIDPVTVSYSGVSGSVLVLTFNSASTGHLITLKHPLSNSANLGINDYWTGYKKIIDKSWLTSETVDIAQYHYALPWMRNSSTFEYVEPASIAYSTAGTAITLKSSSYAILYSMDVRHLNKNNLQDPWDKTNIKSASLGWNSNNHQYLYTVQDNIIWYSYDGGAYWTQQSSGSLGARGTYVVANNPTVGLMSSSYIPIRSVDNGVTFASGATTTFGQQALTWHGPLAYQPDGNWKVFVYKRPSDVVFETDYGTFDNINISGVMDDYSTHYVLPYDVAISDGDLNAVTLTVSATFSRSFTADEFSGDYLKIYDASATASYFYEIDRNSEASTGTSVTLYLKDELQFQPEAGLDKVQIVKRRPEGIYYYSVITRDTTINAYVYNEASGSKFIPSQEQAFDWYANDVIKNGLPNEIATQDNKDRADLLMTEMNRQRVLSNVAFNDPTELPPELLQRLGFQYRTCPG